MKKEKEIITYEFKLNSGNLIGALINITSEMKAFKKEYKFLRKELDRIKKKEK